MAQTNVSIRMDTDLKRDFERLCRDVGMNLTTAFTVFAKQSVRENKIPVELKGDSAWDEVTTTVPGKVIPKDELQRRMEELDAGFGIEMTMEEFEALSEEPLDGPVHREIERRRMEMRARRSAWEARKNG